jgi:hypothetical protein
MDDARTSIMAQAMGPILQRNNAIVRAADAPQDNPRPLAEHTWERALRSQIRMIDAEWRAFESAGGRLPRIEQLLDEHQGNEGSWRAGLLVAAGRPVPPMADRFPDTLRALRGVPGLRYAIWSILEPGVELREHRGPNAGVLRYHLTVASNDHAALQVGETVVPYRPGGGILFDDTALHAAWNRGTTNRVSILCELLRPVSRPACWLNAGVQSLLSLDRRYRLATERALEWDHAMNPELHQGR